MKVLKIVGAIFCALMTLGGAMSALSPVEGSSPGESLILTLVFLVLFILLIRSILSEQKKKDEGIKSSADQYALAVKAEADQYAAKIRADAKEYYSEQKQLGEKYYQSKVDEANQYREKASSEIAELQSQLAALRSDALVELTQIDAYSGSTSDELKNQLALLKVRQDTAIREGSAVEVTASSATQRQINTQAKQLLRCFNAECSNIVGAITAKNVDSSRSKMRRSFDALNKIFVSDHVQISEEYFSLKLEELTLVYGYMVKLEEEKEQKKAIREQMVEEEKVRREIEREKQKIEKEELQFSNEVKKLMSYMQKAKDNVERQLYLDKIKELENKLSALQADKENVLQREQNTRAGFVYIISNIGSFGERVFKIGMTRRLEPMDRIAELSSASVPFPFDVHAMIFSEDAPGLEAVLHQHFEQNRVNKANPRKEFFRVDLDEIKKTVLENHNATVKFVDIPDAVEYRETLKMEQSTQ